jgi:hypothetical protein
MKTMLKIIGIIAALGLFSCSSPKVLTDFDKAANFSSYKYFTICTEDLSVQNRQYPKFDNSTNRDLLRQATINAMEAKGYILNSEKPELQAGFKLAIADNELSITHCYDNSEIGYWQECEIEIYPYTEQTLIMYVLDLDKNQIIWQGILEGGLLGSPKKMKRNIEDKVQKIFDHYPI